MARPVTLFTGQWADLPLEELAAKAGEWGFDGLELACWGDHFEVDRALAEPATRRASASCSSGTGSSAGRSARTSSARRSATRSTTRHRGDPAARGLGRRRPRGRAAARGRADEGHRARRRRVRRQQVNGFTGSAIWHQLYSFPPNDFDEIERGYEDFAERWGPIIDVFDAEGVRFGARGAPDRDRLRLRHDARRRSTRSATARASGSTSTRATSCTSSSTRRRSRGSSPTAIYHVHVKDSRRRLDGRRSILASHLNFGEAEPRLGLRLARPRRRRLRGASSAR